MIRTRLILGLLLAGVRWHGQPRWVASRLGYWARPYCWRLDTRHSRWAHRRCVALCTGRRSGRLTVRIHPEPAAFERALARLAADLPEQMDRQR